MVPDPNGMLRDYADYRPDNRAYYRKHWFRARGCLLAMLVWCTFWGLAIWLSCRVKS